MDRYGNMFGAVDPLNDTIHHSSFFRGQPVAFAGNIEVENGVIRSANGVSGHYLTQQVHLDQFVAELEFQGVNMSGVRVTLTPTRP